MNVSIPLSILVIIGMTLGTLSFVPVMIALTTSVVILFLGDALKVFDVHTRTMHAIDSTLAGLVPSVTEMI